MSANLEITKILVYGKNSVLYNSLLKNHLKISDKYKVVGELSHSDSLDSIDKEAICILFAYSKNLIDNENLLINITSHFKKVLVIGSASVESTRANKFQYSNIKLQQLRAAQNNNIKNVLVANFGEFSPSCRRGKQKISTADDFLGALRSLENGVFGVSKNYKVVGVPNVHLVFYSVLEKICGTKLTAFVFKKFTRFTYGYNIVE